MHDMIGAFKSWRSVIPSQRTSQQWRECTVLEITDEIASNNGLYYVLHAERTFGAQWFGLPMYRSIKKLEGKIMALEVLLSILVVAFWFLWLMDGRFYRYFQLFAFMVWLPCDILLLSTVNKRGAILMFNTFEFWLKTFYLITWFTITLIYANYRTFIRDNYDQIAVWNISNALTGLHWILIFTYCALIDAVDTSRCLKIANAFGSSLWFTYYLLFQQLSISDADDLVYNISVSSSYGKRSFSLLSATRETLTKIVIFYWKQAILAIRRTGRCLLIHFKPGLRFKSTPTTSSEVKPLETTHINAQQQRPEQQTNSTRLEITDEMTARNALYFLFVADNTVGAKCCGLRIYHAIQRMDIVLLTVNVCAQLLHSALWMYDGHVFGYYQVCVSYVVFIPCDLLLFTTLNLRGARLVATTFEFWFKCLYLAVYLALFVVFWNHYYAVREYQEMTIFKAGNIGMAMHTALIVTYAVMSDAVHTSRYNKLLLALYIGIWFAFTLFLQQLALSDSDDIVFDITTEFSSGKRTLSLLSFMQDTLSTITIFIWKQAILTIIRTDKCIAYEYKPALFFVSS